MKPKNFPGRKLRRKIQLMSFAELKQQDIGALIQRTRDKRTKKRRG